MGGHGAQLRRLVGDHLDGHALRGIRLRLTEETQRRVK